MALVGQQNRDFVTTVFNSDPEKKGICRAKRTTRGGVFGSGIMHKFFLMAFTGKDKIGWVARMGWQWAWIRSVSR